MNGTTGHNRQTVDLTNCEREPIHLIGSIQPIGFLVAVTLDWMVRHVSANVGDWLGAAPDDMLGEPLARFIDGEALHTIRGRLQLACVSDCVERAFRVPLTSGGALFDVAVHLSGDSIVIEAEPSEPAGPVDAASLVRSMIGRLERTSGMDPCFAEAARQVRALTGFDRVMVYRFAPDGAGEVIAESVVRGVPSYLGLHFPASDIPAQARALYERNLLRGIADVNAAPSPILPPVGVQGQELDLSLGVLRSVSLIHCEYLRNMGVQASLSVSILQQGRLWGLFACHHLAPWQLSLERRSAAELFGQMFSMMLENRARAADTAYEAQAQRLSSVLSALVIEDASPVDNILALRDEVAKFIHSDGFGVSLNGECVLHGQTPAQDEFRAMVRMLNRAAPSTVFATHELSRHHEPARAYVDRVAGLLAIPISRVPRDCIVFFRKEVARTVTWAGNPEKPAELGPNGIRLTPRKSFEAWRETVQGQSIPWSDTDLRIAETLRITMLEVVLNFADVADKERRQAAQRQELLIAELNHRVRNILALIRALVKQSQASAASVADFADILAGRIQALARAHDQITAENLMPAPLRPLIEAEVTAYLGSRKERVILNGPPVLLSPQAFTVLALVLHELVTNSAKYGAFADSSGRVEMSWTVGPGGSLTILWQEIGGPPVRAPARQGFGTTIIERSIPHDLGGEAEITYALTGVAARFVIPAAHVSAADTRPAPADIPASAPSGEAPPIAGPVLVLEDNMIIALNAEEILRSLGIAQVDIVASVRQALNAVEAARPALAVLDVNLHSETSLPVAERLRELGVPFFFATGYDDADSLPAAYRDVTVLRKPYNSDQFLRALHSIRGG